MTYTRPFRRRRRALLLTPLMLGGLAALAAAPAHAGILEPAPGTNLSIHKVAEKSVAPGEAASWTITVTNEGGSVGVPIADIVVHDKQASDAPLAPDTKPASDELMPGQSLVYTVTTPTDEKKQCATGVTNTATVSLDPKSGLQETRTDDNTATAEVKLLCRIDVALAKTSDRESYAPGDTINYTLTVYNTGHFDVAIGDIRVSDPMLENLRMQLEKDEDGKEPEYLAPGRSLRFTGSRVVTAEDCGPLRNVASVELGDSKRKIDEPYLDNNTDTRTVTIAGEACAEVPPYVPPTLPVTPVAVAGTVAAAPAAAPAKVRPPACPRVTLRTRIAGPRGLVAGARGAYRVTVFNTGANRAHGTALRVAVPSGMAVVGRAPKGAQVKGRFLVWRLGSVSGYGQRTVRISVRADATASGRTAARAFASARCAKRAVASRTVKVAAVRARVQPAVAG